MIDVDNMPDVNVRWTARLNRITGKWTVAAKLFVNGHVITELKRECYSKRWGREALASEMKAEFPDLFAHRGVTT